MEVYLNMTVLTKEEQWRQHIQDCTNSGMSIEAWCTANNLSAYKYHYWKKKFKGCEDQVQTPPIEWAPLTLDSSKLEDLCPTPISIQFEQFKIEVTTGFDEATLSKVLKLFGASC